MNKYLTAKLKEGRLNKGLKQSDVTKYTGIKNTTLSNYENGVTEPDIDTFLQLCELYGLDYSYILGEAYGLGVQGEAFKIKPSEIDRIEKYRFIAEHSPDGVKSVDMILDREYSIALKQREQTEKANALFNNPDYKPLFNADNEIRPEYIGFIKELLDKINKN